jgi:hypothetical protein
MPMRSADNRRMRPAPERTGRKDVRPLSQTSIVALFGLGLMLAGCATNDADKNPPPIPDPKPHIAAVLPKQRPRPPVADTREHEAPADAHEQSAPPPAKVASIDPNRLVGLDPPAIEKMIGAPTSVAHSDPSLVWTYVGSGCSFQIIFYPDIKTTTFHALKFLGSDASGGHLDSSHACIRNILTARNYGPA